MNAIAVFTRLDRHVVNVIVKRCFSLTGCKKVGDADKEYKQITPSDFQFNMIMLALL